MDTSSRHTAENNPDEELLLKEAARSRLVSALPKKAFRLLASYEFSCLILFFLFVLTLLGTLHQVNNGIYAAQQKYFESLVLVQHFGAIPLPLPGGRLLLTLLFFNLLCGAILRARKGWSRIGIFTAHVGILLLLAGAFITYRYAQGGQMVLHEGEQSGYFESPDEWELAYAQLNGTGAARENVIPEQRLCEAGSLGELYVGNKSLPFDFKVGPYNLNSLPQPVEPGAPPDPYTVEGYTLRPKPWIKDIARNVPGAYVTVIERRSGARQRGIVWGGEKAPWTVKTDDGGTWSFELRRRRWPLPFTLVLNKFSRELHPRTAMAKAYESEVTKIEGGKRQAIRISMNEPLRSNGYTFYQASWGPQDAALGSKLYSVLAVSRDPAERFPLYACIIITCGMALHFALRLLGHLRCEGGRKA